MNAPRTKGQVLRAWREARGETLQEVSDRLGCSKVFASDVELKKRPLPPAREHDFILAYAPDPADRGLLICELAQCERVTWWRVDEVPPPDDDRDILVTGPHMAIQIGCSAMAADDDLVTHWRPLPRGPEEVTG